jgi:anti-sigma factor RsiW
MAACESMIPLVLASVEGTLDRAGHDRLTAHLATCPACRRAAAEQAMVKRTLAAMPLAPVSADFAARVRQRVTPPRWLDVANWRTWTLRLVPVTAALVALLVVLPVQGDTADAQAQSLSNVIDSWTAAATGASGSDIELLLDPDAHPNALLNAALQESSR